MKFTRIRLLLLTGSSACKAVKLLKFLVMAWKFSLNSHPPKSIVLLVEKSCGLEIAGMAADCVGCWGYTYHCSVVAYC